MDTGGTDTKRDWAAIRAALINTGEIFLKIPAQVGTAEVLNPSNEAGRVNTSSNVSG